MIDKFMYIPNDNKQNHLFCILQFTVGFTKLPLLQITIYGWMELDTQLFLWVLLSWFLTCVLNCRSVCTFVCHEFDAVERHFMSDNQYSEKRKYIKDPKYVVRKSLQNFYLSHKFNTLSVIFTQNFFFFGGQGLNQLKDLLNFKSSPDL